MIVERRSPRTQKINRMDLPISAEQVARYESGELIQRAFPNLTAEQREFYMSGLTPEDWAALFPPMDDDSPDGEEA